MLRKFILVFIFLFVIHSTSANLETSPVGVDEEIGVNNEYVLSTKDYKIIEKLELRIQNLLDKNPKISVNQIIKILENYKNKTQNKRMGKILEAVVKNLINTGNKVTILEGWNIYDVDDFLYSRNLIQKGEYIEYVEKREKIMALSKFFPFLDDQITLEGYLYPDTYEINISDFKINEFVIQQLEAFEDKVYNSLFINEDSTAKYTNQVIESVINLASIVEKEEKNILEKPVVAGILKKRMKEYWNLGADITVCYPYMLTAKECRLVISKYIAIKSDYNTRNIIGLPPTPIGNPSFETVSATLYDKQTNYYYYLHDTQTGKIYYAETNKEHNKNKELYLR